MLKVILGLGVPPFPSGPAVNGCVFPEPSRQGAKGRSGVKSNDLLFHEELH